MGKKKSKSQKLQRPWCWYCEKDFEDDKVLVTHQRAKHFKCEVCGKRLTTAGGMAVHAQQVHKVEITAVPNALPGRGTLDVEIFGMEGIPPEDIEAHNMRISGGNAPKRQRTDGGYGGYNELTPEQIQQQIAMHKAGHSNPSSGDVSPAAGIPAAPIQQSPSVSAPPTSYNPYYPQAPPPQPAPYGQYNYYQPYPPQPPFTFQPPPGAPAYPGWNPSQPYGQPYAAAPYPPPANPQLATPGQNSPVPPPPAPAAAAAQQPLAQVGQGSYHGATQPAAAAGYDYSASHHQQQPPPGPPAATEDPTKLAQGTSATGAVAPTEGGKKKASNFTLLYNDNEVSPVSAIPFPFLPFTVRYDVRILNSLIHTTHNRRRSVPNWTNTALSLYKVSKSSH
ncbi:hypothetical protein BCR43DRAFT_496392 [Syncephalastrum racemosum]|uniref:C2H2-type domain-containing protein n=1 Tax=Syncephalastrum racemosum TaxID=13706 RepID=A0A1X2H426_SYNRA|nr:hypothetical protein BCR43DRAFT_496392 [Syncephalastrum racemosum]